MADTNDKKDENEKPNNQEAEIQKRIDRMNYEIEILSVQIRNKHTTIGEINEAQEILANESHKEGISENRLNEISFQEAENGRKSTKTQKEIQRLNDSRRKYIEKKNQLENDLKQLRTMQEWKQTGQDALYEDQTSQVRRFRR